MRNEINHGNVDDVLLRIIRSLKSHWNQNEENYSIKISNSKDLRCWEFYGIFEQYPAVFWEMGKLVGDGEIFLKHCAHDKERNIKIN